MRTTTAIVLSTLLLAGTAAALPLNLPTCGVPALSILCVGIVVGDVVVGPNQPSSEAEFNNGTYVFQGTVTVEDGGRVEIIASTVAFGDEAQPIHVLSGGTLIIDGSNLTDPTLGADAVIYAEDGAIVEIKSSDFSNITLVIETDTASFGSTSEYNTFAGGAPAILLKDFDGTIGGSKFAANDVGIEVSGGSVTLEDLEFMGDAVGITLNSAVFDIKRISMTDMTDTGVRSLLSEGTMANMVIADRIGPPTNGLDIQDSTGTVNINDNDIGFWGTGLYTCNANAVLSGNVFHDNLQDFGSCIS